MEVGLKRMFDLADDRVLDLETRGMRIFEAR